VLINSTCATQNQCANDQFILADPTPTSNRVCASAGTVTVLDFVYSADSIGSVPRAILNTDVLQLALANGRFDQPGARVRLTPASKSDNPPSGTLYVNAQLEVSSITASPSAATEFLSNSTTFFSELKAALPASVPNFRDPLGTAILELNVTFVTFRVAFLFASGADVHSFTSLVSAFVNNASAIASATSLSSQHGALVDSAILNPIVTPFIHVGKRICITSMRRFPSAVSTASSNFAWFVNPASEGDCPPAALQN
jgi:hypothetical protein